jgi:8-oxo-dGTP diphosphatase
MSNSTYVNWDGHIIKLTWLPGFIPELDTITSVHGYCFEADKLLLVNIKGRGFNIPGGHIEQGETPEDALHREVYEEGYVKGNAQFIGALELNHEENPLFDSKGKYPLVGYQLFYAMQISEKLPFKREHEATARVWVEPSEVPYLINDHEIALVILEDALKK